MTRTEQLLNKLKERICHISDALHAFDDNVTACLNHEALEPFVEGRSESDLEFSGFDNLQTACVKLNGLFYLFEAEVGDLHKHREKVDALRDRIDACSKQLKKLQTPEKGVRKETTLNAKEINRIAPKKE